MPEMLDQSEIEQFLEWEQASRDTIDVKRIYIDLAGDLVTGILLSQIIYWFLPQNGESRLRVEREGRSWLAKLRTDWWNECRITPKQFDRSIQILKDKGLVETKRFQFRGSIPTLHIWLNISALVQGVKSILPKGENGSLPKGKVEVPERVKSSTETTNIDYLTEIRESDIEATLKSLLTAVVKLPYWRRTKLEDDVSWLIEFLSEFPELSEQLIKECRDFWDGKQRPRGKGDWKNRLRNWCKNARRIAASPRPRPISQQKKERYSLPDSEALKKKAEALGIKR